VWRTIFVLDHQEELRPPREFPPFIKEGEVMLFKTDEFDNSRVPFRFVVAQVIFDVISLTPTQYVHLQEIET
jgi:hypothetical protein